MPPRFAYWTIILDGAPTSFRMKERDEILPLFNQLKSKNPGALLKWFSGGRLWDSPEQAKEVRDVEKVRRFREERAKEAKEQHEGGEDPLAEFRRQHGRPADGSDQKVPEPTDPNGRAAAPPRPRSNRPPGDRRGKDWRPGGEHKDPRDKYKLPPGEARKRWKDRNLGPRVPRPFGGPSTRDGGDRSLRTGKPGGDRPYVDRPRGDRPFGGKPSGDRPFSDRPRGDRPYGSKPGGDRPYGDRPPGPRPFGNKPGGDRPYGDKPRGPKPFGSKPGGDRPYGDRPRGPKPFGSKPGGDRPYRRQAAWAKAVWEQARRRSTVRRPAQG